MDEIKLEQLGRVVAQGRSIRQAIVNVKAGLEIIEVKRPGATQNITLYSGTMQHRVELQTRSARSLLEIALENELNGLQAQLKALNADSEIIDGAII